MKILKRNQLIILVISLMLITAGYLNFTANQENIMTSTIADRSDSKIGDAELVSTIPKDEQNNDVTSNEQINTLNTTNQNNVETTLDDQQSEENEILEASNTSEIATAASTEDYYFTTSKLERNNMYSESLETYQEMYNNNNSTRRKQKRSTF